MARGEVSDLIGCTAKEIIFTSGATESNNLAIKGVAGFYERKKKHIITTQTEHKCVLDSCRHLESRGFEVTYLPVEKGTGLVNLDHLRSVVRKGETSLISVMAVNNEVRSSSSSVSRALCLLQLRRAYCLRPSFPFPSTLTASVAAPSNHTPSPSHTRC